jgi:hypothetical protein
VRAGESGTLLEQGRKWVKDCEGRWMETRGGDEIATEEREEDEHEGAGGGVGKRVVSDLISYWELKKKGVSFGVHLGFPPVYSSRTVFILF